MTAHTPILSNLTKTINLCLGLLAAAQFSAHASTRVAEVSQQSQSHMRELVSVADGQAVTDNNRGYFTPPDDTRPLPPTGTGSVGRGGSCNPAAGATAFTALGPASTLGLTTQVNPEFSWYVSPSEEGAPLMFRLLQVQENGRQIPMYWQELTAQTGFMSYQLSNDAPSLEIGQDYVWQVVVKCDQNRSLTSSLPIRVVTSDADLTAQLSTAITDAERAVVYGQAGLWYDAFAQVMSSTTPAESEVRAGLLSDLAAAEVDNQTLNSVLLAIVEETGAR